MGAFYSDTRLFRCVVILWLSVLLAGCGAGSWGQFTHSKALMDHYQNKTLPDHYKYYYTGSASKPSAVVGIDPSYGFETRAWVSIDSREDLYRKIKRLGKIEDIHTFLNTKDILSFPGHIIGVWFSYYDSTIVRVDENSRQLEVSTPYQAVPKYYRRGYRSIFRDD